jgi:hypothetical protein
VLRICRALDGLPLAIELAAARLRALPLGDLGERLDDRFRLLSRGDRTAQPRHQTLRAVVEWSWDLIDDAERTLARRLTVFAGGATREAAERVCGLPAAEVGELLASLADKSLVEAAGDDGRRYRMLETVRAFCAEHLAEAGEWERLRRAHLAYFLDLAETADPHLRAAEQLRWLARLDAEHDDLHAALRRAVDAAEVRPALRLLAALSWYWWLRGRRSEGATLAGDLLGALGTEPPAGLEEEYALCVLYAAVGGVPSPRLPAHLEAAQSIVYAIYATERSPRQPLLLVLSALTGGSPGEDVDVGPVRQRYLTGPDPWIRAIVQFGTGYERRMGGQVAEAEHEFSIALAGFRAIGERWGTAIQAVLTAAPDSQAAEHAVDRLRTATHAVPGSRALVGGDTAATLDTERTAARDNRVVMPLILAVVLLVLAALLRALVASLLLLASAVLSFAAALGAAGLIFQAIGHPRIFYGLPLQAFLFLVALGVDYTIFLMTRAREETAELGQTAAGVLRALTVTGGVITSAGLVLAATFSALTVLPLVPSVQIGIIVAVGVLLDTLVVRSLLIPALAVHIGARVWWPSRLGAQPTQPTPAQAARVRPAEPTRMR